MNAEFLKLAVIAAASSLLFSNPIVAQNPPPQKRAEDVEMTKPPALEIAHDDLAIIRWTITNLAGMTIIRGRALRYGSRGLERDGEKSYQAQPRPR